MHGPSTDRFSPSCFACWLGRQMVSKAPGTSNRLIVSSRLKWDKNQKLKIKKVATCLHQRDWGLLFLFFLTFTVCFLCGEWLLEMTAWHPIARALNCSKHPSLILFAARWYYAGPWSFLSMLSLLSVPARQYALCLSSLKKHKVVPMASSS